MQKRVFIKMNNKGQTLVIFIILIPKFLLILTLIVDLGFLSIEKRKVSNNTYDAVKYYLENTRDDNIYNKTVKLLEANLDDIDINIIDNNDYVEIEVNKEYKSVYSSILGSINVKYRGIKSSKEIIKG